VRIRARAACDDSYVRERIRNAPLPIMRRKTAAIAVCGRIAQLPAHEIARDARLLMGTTFCASRAAARIRSSRPSGTGTSGSEIPRRVERRPFNTEPQRAHPDTWRLTAALVSSSSSS
jgi:hypothetical protein